MRALTVEPGVADSARLDDVPLPAAHEGEVLVRGLAAGICGTDREITEGKYGKAPSTSDRLILGHESLGRVEEIRGSGTSLKVGDLVVAMVRHPDPVPCANCAAGEWDMCRNGQYTEHGIVGRHGFATEYYRLSRDRLVRVPNEVGELGVLVEPASIVAKAWEHIDRIGGRARWNPTRVLITGAGPIGLLGALLGHQRGLEVHVFDRAPTGIKPELVHALGGTYHFGPLDDVNVEADIILECTGASAVIWDVLSLTTRAGIVCLTGVSLGGHRMSVDVGQMNRDIVLENDVVFGTVNANRRHYEAAVQALSLADASWLRRMITRRIPLSEWQAALRNEKEDIKVVLELTA
ncbi:MAG: glucose 1-dehydrogenase [Gemmatimonadota bacterium]|nr:glucose 1-dehydrogenase [Gemmatimonadota bacterium]